MKAFIVQGIEIILMSSVLSLFGVASCNAQECRQLQAATPDRLVAYLEGLAPNEGNGNCITFAIKTLGAQRYEPATPVLTRLLDSRRPLTTEEKVGVRTLHTFYPATVALEEIGKNSLPNVLKAIKGDSTSEKTRENSVAVWMEIYKYARPKGVASLKCEAAETSDTSIKERLDWAVSNALLWCSPAEIAKCKAAAKTGYSK